MKDVKYITIDCSSSSRLDLATYAHTSLEITLAPQVRFLCMYTARTDIELSLVFHVSAGAEVDAVLLFAQGAHMQCNLAVHLMGERAQAHIRGLYAVRDKAQVQITTLQHHQAPHTTSTLTMRGMLNDAAHASYHGTVLVDTNAVHTSAAQENKNMLLSRSAHAQSQPRLEVLTNDVHCTHGSAVGYLDEQALWYAAARGIDEKTARVLLMHGFFTEIIDELDANVVSDIHRIIKDIASDSTIKE